jgi:hypothetical protein
MRPRLTRALPVCLCLLMLCVSSFASVCQLSCSLAHDHPHPSVPVGVATPAAITPSHCAHMHVRGAGNGTTVSMSNSGCVQTPCGRPDILSSAAKSDIALGVDYQVTAVASHSTFDLPGLALSSSSIQLDRRTTPFSPLLSVLRI